MAEHTDEQLASARRRWYAHNDTLSVLDDVLSLLNRYDKAGSIAAVWGVTVAEHARTVDLLEVLRSEYTAVELGI